MVLLLSLPLTLLGACGAGKVELGDDTGETGGDSGETGETGDTPGETGDTAGDTGESAAETADTGPADRDGDGWTDAEDCADEDASIHPGQEERWNGLDDDCDGVIDGDGRYTGTSTVTATAVYKGRAVRFDLSCPTTLDRASGALTWTVACTPDAGDDTAQLLLGSSLTVSATDEGMGGSSWAGACNVASSNGWDTDADATVTWEDFGTVSLAFRLSASSLSVSGSGRLAR